MVWIKKIDSKLSQKLCINTLSLYHFFMKLKNQKDINEYFHFKTIELYFWISEEINVLLTNWMNLFYLNQVKDSYEASNLNEYRFYVFSGTENNMKIQASSAELLKSKEYKHIFPIKTRQQFEDFRQWYTVRCYISHINEIQEKKIILLNRNYFIAEVDYQSTQYISGSAALLILFRLSLYPMMTDLSGFDPLSWHRMPKYSGLTSGYQSY